MGQSVRYARRVASVRYRDRLNLATQGTWQPCETNTATALCTGQETAANR